MFKGDLNNANQKSIKPL